MRNNKFILFVRLLLSAVYCIVIQCSPTSTVDPGGSEITNGVVHTGEGVPLANVVVTAYPVNYLSGYFSESNVARAQTDSNGAFEIALDNDTYNLFIIDSSNNIGAVVSAVGPNDALGTINLEKLGTVSGSVKLSGSTVGSFLMYSRGTPFKTNIVASNPVFRFEMVPQGEYHFSFGVPPLVGCVPGKDCLPGYPGGGADVEVEVTAGGEALIDTTVLASDLEVLP